MSAETTEEVSQKTIEISLNSALDKTRLYIPDFIDNDIARSNFVADKKRMIRLDLLSKITAKNYLNGELQTDPQTAKLLSVEDIFNQQYAMHLQPAKNPPPEQQKAKPGEAFLETKAEVMAFLQKKYKPQGILLGNVKFNDEYTRIITQQGITQ